MDPTLVVLERGGVGSGGDEVCSLVLCLLRFRIQRCWKVLYPRCITVLGGNIQALSMLCRTNSDNGKGEIQIRVMEGFPLAIHLQYS